MSIGTVLDALVKQYGPCEAIVVGMFGGGGWDADDMDPKLPTFIPLEQRGVPLPYEGKLRDTLRLVNFTGFGGPYTYPVYAWFKDFVAYVHEYDGSTHMAVMPRHPCQCLPGWG